MDLIFEAGLLAFIQVIFLDVILSADNAIVIGSLAASLPDAQRDKAILYGMIAAIVMRITLSLVVVWLLMIPGLKVAGGLLLLYVAYGMWNDLRDDGSLDDSTEKKDVKTFGKALLAIALADLSMSLDNILGVAGAASDHPVILAFGLVLSIGLMGFAAKYISNIINKYTWIAYIGLALILFVSAKMIYEGYPQLLNLI